MKYLFFIFPFSLFLLPQFATAQQKTIYEVLGLKEGGCESNRIYKEGRTLPKEEQEESYSVEGEWNQSSKGQKKATLDPKDLNDALAAFPNLIQTLPDSTKWTGNFKLTNGNYTYKEKGKYGLKNKKGKKLIAPIFTRIYVDKKNTGFVGCIDDACNYYQKKKKVLPKDYFYVNRMFGDTFFVKGKNGMGAITPKSIVMPPIFEFLSPSWKNNIPYFQYFKGEENQRIIALNEMEQFFCNSIYVSEQVGHLTEEYILTDKILISRTTGRQLICETGYELSLFDKKTGTLLLNDVKKEQYYLIDKKGIIRTPKAYKSIKKVESENGDLLLVSQQSEEDGQQSIKYGMLDFSGNQLIPISHSTINATKYGAIASNEKKEQAFITYENEIFIPFGNHELKWLWPDYLVQYSKEDKPLANIWNLKTKKLLKENLPYYGFLNITCCDGKIFKAMSIDGNRDNAYFNTNFEFLGSDPNATDIASNAENPCFSRLNKKQKAAPKAYVDCQGNPITFNVDGKEITYINDWHNLNKNWGYLDAGGTASPRFINQNTNKEILLSAPLAFQKQLKFRNLLVFKNLENGKMGLYDQDMNLLLPLLFDKITDIFNAIGEEGARYLFLQYQNGIGKIINQEGTEVLAGLDVQGFLSYGLFTFKQDDRFGLVDESGNILIAPEYRRLKLEKGQIFAHKKGVEGYFLFSMSGKLIRKY